MESIVQFVTAVFRIPVDVALAFALAICNYFTKVKMLSPVIIPSLPNLTKFTSITTSPPKKKKKKHSKKKDKKQVVVEKSVGEDASAAAVNVTSEEVAENPPEPEIDVQDESIYKDALVAKENIVDENIDENPPVAVVNVPSENVKISAAMIEKIIENVPDALKSSVEAFLNTNFKIHDVKETASLILPTQADVAEAFSSDPGSGNPSSEEEVVSPTTSFEDTDIFEAAIKASLKDKFPAAWETPKTPKSSKKSRVPASPTSSNKSSPTVLCDNNPFSVLSRDTEVTPVKKPLSVVVAEPVVTKVNLHIDVAAPEPVVTKPVATRVKTGLPLNVPIAVPDMSRHFPKKKCVVEEKPAVWGEEVADNNEAEPEWDVD